MADEQPGATPDTAPQSSEPTPKPDGFKSEESKQSVLADLATERQARKDLESKFNRLAEALGGDAKNKDADLAEMVGQLTQRIEVSDLARKHGITDEDDIASLMAVTNADARGRLATRLAPKVTPDEKSGEQPLPRPKPDATQGPKGEPAKPDPGPGQARMRAAYAASETKK